MNAPEHDPLAIVSTQSLECELKLLCGAAAGSLSGIFGPRSITWQVNREAAIFLGAGRALWAQLSRSLRFLLECGLWDFVGHVCAR